MTAPDSPVTFESRGDGREVAMLGALDIGEIAPASANAGGLVIWKLSLPYAPVCWSRLCSIDTARRELRRRIEDWLDAARLAPIAAREPEIRAFRPDDWGRIKQAVRT